MNKRDGLLLTIPIFLLVLVIISSGIYAASQNNSSSNVNMMPIVNSFGVPVITLNGDAIVHVPFGSNYTDAGATAVDIAGKNITAGIITSNPVVTSISGTFTVAYTVSDSYGNIVTRNRTVIVASSPVSNDGLIVNNTNETANATAAATEIPNATSNTGAANLFTGAATATGSASAPITGGVVEALTSTGGIVGMVAFAFVLVMAIIIVRARKKYNKKMHESISTTLAEGNKKI
jgi:hypothetical protein